MADLEDKLGDIVKTKFDNINDEFSSQLEMIEHENNLLETQLDLIEAKGMFAGQAYYTQLMSNEEKYIEKLHDQYMDLSEAMYDALDSGKLVEGSEAWYDMVSEINSVSEAWAEAKKQLVDYKNEAYDMDWSIFEKGISYFSDITDESEFLQNILRVGDNDVFVKKTGRLNEKGNAINSLHAMNYNADMALADKYKEKIAELNEEIAKDPTNTKLIDQRNEYVKSQRESIEAANDEKKAIQSLIKESYDKMLEVLQDLIDKRKDFLDSTKDLYDYEKEISEKTKTITDLQKQINSLGGDDSEETQSRVQSLKDQLKEAQDDLADSEYEQYITDQEKLLDNLYTEYEKVLNERLDNIDGLLTEVINATNTNSATINQTITDATSKVGYDLSEGMKSIWTSTDSGVGKILTEYSNNFLSVMNNVTEYLLYIFHKMGGKTAQEVEADRLKQEAEKKRQEELKKQQAAEAAKKAQQQTQQQQQTKTVAIGSTVNAGSATIYGNSYGGGAGRQYFANDPVYTVVGENNGYWLVRWHGLSSGYTGWFKKNEVTAMATGGYTGDEEGMAYLHKKERVLSATQTRAWESLVNNFLPHVSEEMSKLQSVSELNEYGNKIGGTSNIDNKVSLNISLPNVNNSSDFIKAIQTDKSLQGVIKAITIDEALGKNTLTKYKY